MSLSKTCLMFLIFLVKILMGARFRYYTHFSLSHTHTHFTRTHTRTFLARKPTFIVVLKKSKKKNSIHNDFSTLWCVTVKISHPVNLNFYRHRVTTLKPDVVVAPVTLKTLNIFLRIKLTKGLTTILKIKQKKFEFAGTKLKQDHSHFQERLTNWKLSCRL